VKRRDQQIAAVVLWIIVCLAFGAYASIVFASQIELRETPPQSVTLERGNIKELAIFPNVVSNHIERHFH